MVACFSGVLIAPTIGLNPQLLTYLVVQAFGAAAIGRFKSLPLTFVGGWIIGIVAAWGGKYANQYPVAARPARRACRSSPCSWC